MEKKLHVHRTKFKRYCERLIISLFFSRATYFLFPEAIAITSLSCPSRDGLCLYKHVMLIIFKANNIITYQKRCSATFFFCLMMYLGSCFMSVFIAASLKGLLLMHIYHLSTLLLMNIRLYFHLFILQTMLL